MEHSTESGVLPAAKKRTLENGQVSWSSGLGAISAVGLPFAALAFAVAVATELDGRQHPIAGFLSSRSRPVFGSEAPASSTHCVRLISA